MYVYLEGSTVLFLQVDEAVNVQVHFHGTHCSAPKICSVWFENKLSITFTPVVLFFFAHLFV